MLRRSKPAPAGGPGSPHVIDPHAVYFADTFREWFRLTRSTLRREVREGRLRVARRAGRYYLLGEWVLQWLRAGEYTPKVAGQGAPARNGTAAQ